MANIAARTVYGEFTKDIDRAGKLLDLINSFREFAGQPGDLTGYSHDLWNAAQGVRVDLPILSGSLLLYLCGRFEFFVRELVGTVVDDLVDKARKYDELPESLRREYLNRTLTINASPGKFNYTKSDASALAAELANNLAGNGGGPNLRINSDIITITDSNMHQGMLADIFRRVGITNLWDTLGQQLPLKTHIGESTNEGCKRAASSRLDEIMKLRNTVAHPISNMTFPDVKEVQEVAEYFRILGQVLLDLAIAPR